MSLYQQRHYEDQAHVMRRHRMWFTDESLWVRHVLDMCNHYKRDNPKFKPVLFLKACGLSDGEATLLRG
jgi:hypothetical protein